VLQHAAERGVTLSTVQAFKSLPGRGLSACVGKQPLLIGSRRLMEESGVDLKALDSQAGDLESGGQTLMWVAETGNAVQVLGFLSVVDPVRTGTGARGAMEELRKRGIETVMLTGDNPHAARIVGTRVGIDRVIAEVLPAEKASNVEKIRSQGRIVAMVGDGINDAPALAAADIGIAMGTGTDVAMHTAGITLMRGEPELVLDALSISGATYRKIRQNLFWALIYNLVAIPLAASGMLNPVIAGAAMAMSSVSVVSNSLLLRRFNRNKK